MIREIWDAYDKDGNKLGFVDFINMLYGEQDLTVTGKLKGEKDVR